MKKDTISEDYQGQRIDNYLMARFRSLPKARIYRALRTGEVRVNSGRVKPSYRLQANDVLRLPPFESKTTGAATPIINTQKASQLAASALYEDEAVLIVNKPSGIPVHGGTGIQGGLIEMWRVLKEPIKCLELVHRLDRETSGCLVMAKKRATLIGLNQQLARQQIQKRYIALVRGRCSQKRWQVDAPLHRYVLPSGERRVRVSSEGKAAATQFRCLRQFDDCALLEALPLTGRTHQIRVHACHSGYPIAGDHKYGDDSFNRQMYRFGLKRLFLHAMSIRLTLPQGEKQLYVGAKLDHSLTAVLSKLGVVGGIK